MTTFVWCLCVIIPLLLPCLLGGILFAHREGFNDGYKVGRAQIEDHNDR